MLPDCPLCISENEQIILANDLFRIIHVNDKFYPGYIRLILNEHFTEMTDIDEKKAQRIFSALLIIERHMRKILNPDKINLASLGNVVPHLHWHIIPRYKDDRHFPFPIWGAVSNADYQVPDYLLELTQSFVNELAQEQFLL